MNTAVKHDFKPGDRVVHRSIETPLYIESIAADGNLICIWFDRFQRLERKTYRPSDVKPCTADVISLDEHTQSIPMNVRRGT